MLASYFIKAATLNQGFWKNPIWKPNQRFFNFKKLQAAVISFYKDLGIFFHCYLLSTVREKIYRNLPWWKEILTIQNSWSFLWIEKKPIIFTLERDWTWGHSVFWGEVPQNTEWPWNWAVSYTRKIGTRGYLKKKEMTNTCKMPPTPKY